MSCGKVKLRRTSVCLTLAVSLRESKSEVFQGIGTKTIRSVVTSRPTTNRDISFHGKNSTKVLLRSTIMLMTPAAYQLTVTSKQVLTCKLSYCWYDAVLWQDCGHLVDDVVRCGVHKRGCYAQNFILVEIRCKKLLCNRATLF